MKNKDSTFQLNFTIPEGPTGPTGLVGNRGSQGSFNQNDAYTFIEYAPSSTYNVPLSIVNYKIIPDNQTAFQVVGGFMTLTEPGYYLFTISGLVKEVYERNTNIILRTRRKNGAFKDLIYVYLNTSEKEKYFSYTKLGFYSEMQEILIILNKIQSSLGTVEGVTLAIQKISL